MIRSKKGTVTKQKITTCSSDTDLKFMAYVRNYQCFFCQKKRFIKNFDDVKCDSCGSQWFQKLDDKKAKTVEAI